MTSTQAQAILPALLVVTLILQAALPSYRLLIVMTGAALSCLATSLLGLGHASQILADVPWDVLVILVGLGLVSEVFVESRIFGVLAMKICRASRADPRRIAIFFAIGMFSHGGLV